MRGRLIVAGAGIAALAFATGVVIAPVFQRFGAVRAISQRVVPESTVRRVVTGHDETGKSVVLSDGPVPRSEDFGDTRYIELWRTDASPAPIRATEPHEPTDVPLTVAQPDGSVVRYVDFAPASNGGKRTPMHRTRTIDYGVVLEGEVVLILDDSEVTLKQGDVVIQRGTNHAWENRTAKPARIVFVLLDGKFDPALEAKLPNMELTP
jgi:quercetin dioxygenase-like cupin family protein